MGLRGGTRAAAVWLALLAAAPGFAEQARAEQAGVVVSDAGPEAVLLLGNSLVRGVDRHLRKLLSSEGAKATVRRHAPSAWTLANHVASGSTRRRLASRPWDLIVMQEQSAGMSLDRFPDARALTSLVRAAGAEPMFLMTWRRRDEPLEAYRWQLGEPGGWYGYVPIAYELEVPIAPGGWAVATELAHDPSADLWRDQKHLNTNGRYLVACVLYASITGRSPSGLAWSPGRMSDSEAAHWQALAAETVLGYLELWDPASDAEDAP